MAFGIDDAIAAGLSIVNKLIPDPAARAAAELEAFRLKQAGEFKEIEAVLTEQQQITLRQQNDMASDSWLSKNIRPLVMIYLLVLVTLEGFGKLLVTPEFLGMTKEFVVYGLMFYFGGRSIEKVASMVPAMIASKEKGK